ncbi:MAG: hypothetical protein K1X74_11420 [Pirellulales bacterium]|nr:hypothetical protein [Pirellulales bacterium]
MTHPEAAGRRRFIATTLLCFVAWCVARSEVILLPPTLDQARGVWFEGVYLAHTNFDYHRLLTEEPGPDTEAAKNYIVSIVPTLIAIVLKASHSVRFTIATFHLLNFLLAAAIVACVYCQLQPHLGSLAAGFTAAALATNPVFCVQSELIGMDLPVAACGVAAAALLARERYVATALVATLAFGIKSIGAIVSFAAICQVFVLLLGPRYLPRIFPAPSDPQDVRRRKRGLVVLGLALMGQLLASALGGSFSVLDLPSFAMQPAAYWEAHRFFRFDATTYLCPDLLVVFAVAALAGLMGVTAQCRTTAAPGPRPPHAVRNVVLFAWLVVLLVGMLTAWAAFYVRYWTLGIPFLFLVAAFGLFGLLGRQRGRAIVAGAFAVMCAFNVLNWNGGLLPTLEPRVGARYAYWPAVLERSHEYLINHRRILAAYQGLAQHRDRYIVSNYPFGLFLALPDFGYVDHPFHGYDIGLNTKLFAHFSGQDLDAAVHGPGRPPLFFWGADHAWRPEVPLEAGDQLIAGAASPPIAYAFDKLWLEAPPV